MNPTDPDFPPHLRDHYPTVFEYEQHKEALKLEGIFCDSADFARGVLAERDRVREKEQHVGSLALYATVTLKKLPVQVRYTLMALATLWAIVLASLVLSAGVAGLFALTGLFSHQDVLLVFSLLWILTSVVELICTGVICAASLN